MRTRWVTPLVLLLVAAQLLLAVPANAFARASAADNSSHPCDTMREPTESDVCPCCPDGTDSMKDCLVSCTLAAAAIATRVMPMRVNVPTAAIANTPAPPFTSYSAPPLKPPPIP